MKQGKRTDLLEIKQHLDEGKNENFIADTFFSKWVVYRKSFTAYQCLKAIPRNFKTIVVCLWGVTGTGKTHFCFEQIGERSVWLPGDYKWFDGYQGQDCVLLDDYRGEYDIGLFLKLMDKYPMRVPVKGGFANWNPKKVYITSNVKPDLWYECGHQTYMALMRRFTVIHEIIEPLF